LREGGVCGLLTRVIATTGDSSGNLSFGLSPEEVKLFPEVELNYWVSDKTNYTRQAAFIR
jgi:large subunit ribosomal protein L5